MWLINVKTLQLEEFVSEQCPSYAVLSHRWQDDEVSFEDMKDISKAKRKKGFYKITKTCGQAGSAGLSYAWVDTCCINKKSDAELSEAINSMFEWYSKSKVCYVYLVDVHSVPSREDSIKSVLATPFKDEFRRSSWFTRGWTLQELIAPKHMTFFNSRWLPLGDKMNLLEMLSSITGVHRNALAGWPLSNFTIATKMSWAAHRVTTRREDVAYCLLGIFDINMPLLYGEGSKAFRRLQEEIIRRSDDCSIFLWRQRGLAFSSMLTTSADNFPTTLIAARNVLGGCSYALTNRGLDIDVYLRPWSPQVCVAFLSRHEVGSEGLIAIALCRFGDDSNPHWRRIHTPALETGLVPCLREWRGWQHQRCSAAAKFHHLNIREYESTASHRYYSNDYDYILKRRHGFNLQVTDPVNHYIRTISCSRYSSTKHFDTDMDRAYEIHSQPFPNRYLNSNLEPGEYGITLMLETIPALRSLHQIALGFDFDGVPFLIATKRRHWRQRPPNQHRTDPNMSDASPSPVIRDHLDPRTLPINRLIDEDYPYTLLNPELEEVVEARRQANPCTGLKWTSLTSSTRYQDGKRIHAATQEGIWAFKGFEWKAHLRLAADDEEGLAKFLIIEFQYHRSETKFPCTVWMNFYDSKWTRLPYEQSQSGGQTYPARPKQWEVNIPARIT